MKIIRFDAVANPATLPVTDEYFTQNAVLMADSSIRPHRRPLFLPENPTFSCELRIAIRIDRLGKAISRKFASRYYSEFTILNYLVRKNQNEVNTTLANMLDDAIVYGEWLPIHSGPQTIQITGLSDCKISKEIDISTQFIDAALEILSREATFKTGDIIILPNAALEYAPKPDMKIVVTLNDTSLLDFKIK